MILWILGDNMRDKTKTSLVIMTLVVLALGLMLVFPTDSGNVVALSLHIASGMTYDLKQYEPVVAFKEKYPDYIILSKSDYPRGDKNAEIVYAYTNSSLYRTETLSVNRDHSNPSFNQKCLDESDETVGIRTAKLAHISKKNIDEFLCANYNIDSQTLQKLHATKRILEKTDFPIKYVKYNYDDESLTIRLFEFPKDSYESKINAILSENQVTAKIEYQGFGIVRLN